MKIKERTCIMERIQTIVLFITGLILLGCLVYGVKLREQSYAGVDINQALESGGLQKSYSGLPYYPTINNNLKTLETIQ